MNSLISINHKFMSLTPEKLINLILESRYTKGVEVFVNVDNENELKYLDDLVIELKKHNMILQIHGNVGLKLASQFEFIKKLEKYSEYLNEPINFTLHSIYDKDFNISIKKTTDYINEIINNIDNNKIIVCLENLNNLEGCIRLGKEEIKNIVLENEKIFFTYDIGHEIADHGKIIDLEQNMLKKIRNVHIHSNDNRGDHIPIYNNDYYWNDIIKGLKLLINNNYKYNIVYEYGLEYCNGNTTEEKIRDYLNSIDNLSKIYND